MNELVVCLHLARGCVALVARDEVVNGELSAFRDELRTSSRFRRVFLRSLSLINGGFMPTSQCPQPFRLSTISMIRDQPKQESGREDDPVYCVTTLCRIGRR